DFGRCNSRTPQGTSRQLRAFRYRPENPWSLPRSHQANRGSAEGARHWRQRVSVVFLNRRTVGPTLGGTRNVGDPVAVELARQSPQVARQRSVIGDGEKHLLVPHGVDL